MRLDNWQNNLSALIEDRRTKPFDFASHNCLVWAADGIEAVTGVDILADYRGKYKDEKAAARLLRKIDNVKTSQELLIKKIGEIGEAFPEGWIDLRPVAFARMGDVVFVDPNDIEVELPADIDLFGPVPGVCYGAISYFVGIEGLVEVPTLSLGQAIWVS